MIPATQNQHFLGLRTVIYSAPDISKAKAWYAEVLGIAPYFDQPFYVGFSVSGYELGLDPDAPAGVSGSIIYWGVEDAEQSYQRLLSLGAVSRTSVTDVGDAIRVATVTDPFGNVFGVIQNPHFHLPS